MKNYLLTGFAFLLLSQTQAQSINDGLRYSVDRTYGTARFQAMSGAFGALGGDYSAMAINPAGSAIFLNTGGSVSLSVNDIDNTSTYFNTNTQAFDTDVNINQAGAVFVFDIQNEESPWRKVSMGINFENTSNHDNELFIAGDGNTSIGEFFTQQAQGIPLNLLELQGGESIASRYQLLGAIEGARAQNAFLGYQGFIFNPLSADPTNEAYTSNVGAGRFDQEYIRFSRGFNGKYTFNVGAQYKDNWFFGINLNSHSVDYTETSFISENNNNATGTINAIDFENNLSVAGGGFSAQVGIITKVTPELRLGFTYDTPTWFVISEETTQFLATVRTEEGQNITEVLNPQVLNVFQDYNLQTPGKFSGSAAYVFGKNGLLSVDYSYKDYSNIIFTPKNDPFFSSQNSLISNTLQAASTLKVGGEYRVNQLSLRGGISYEQSPYKNEKTLGDRQGFSLGLGYNFGNYTFDLAYARSEQSSNPQLYSIGLTDRAQVDAVFSNILFTLGFNL